jgi:diguanylate cyclase (GGDEF)-like protein
MKARTINGVMRVRMSEDGIPSLVLEPKQPRRRVVGRFGLWLLGLLYRIALINPPVRPASLAEMETRVDGLLNSRLRHLTLPPDIQAAFAERQFRASRKMMAGWCNVIALLNLPTTILDFGDLHGPVLIFDLATRALYSIAFLLCGRLYMTHRLAGRGHLPAVALAIMLNTVPPAVGLAAGSGEMFLVCAMMGFFTTCTGIVLLPIHRCGRYWIASCGTALAALFLAISPLDSGFLKAQIILFFGIIAGALVYGRNIQTLYQHQLFLLRVRDEIRTAKAALRAEQLTNYAYIDPLTDVPNRRYFNELAQTICAAPQNATPLAVALLDIDHFKNLNDRLGHAAGDQCLRAVAATIRTNLRSRSDTLARYGGEEFVLILPQTDAAAAQDVVERIRQAVLALGHPNPGTLLGRVSISAGLHVASSLCDLQIPLLEADKALYRAKMTGRNKVSV